MFGLSLLDLIVIIVYFLAMIGIGMWSMSRIKNQEDFFLGGRGFGKLIQVFANFGQATSSETGPSIATTTYNNGASGVWANLLMLFNTPFYWFTAPWYRRLRCITLADYYEERFASKKLGGAYAIISSVGLGILLSLGFLTMTKTVMIMTPKAYEEFSVNEKAEYKKAIHWEELETMSYASLNTNEKQLLEQYRVERPKKNFSHLNKYILIFSMVFIVCLYSVMGGLEAAFISDLIQGVFIIILSIMLVPFSIIQINKIYGGHGVMDAFKTMHQQLPESFFEVFGSPNTVDFTWYYIAAVAFMSLINASAQANTFVTPSSAKNEYTARFGMTFGMYLKRLTTVLWGLTALLVVLLYGSKISDPDVLWGYASKELLGPLNFGLIGLMIASLMAALMSTADMMMITTSGLLTRSVYKPLVKNKSEKHYVAVGRSLGAIVVISAAIMTLVNDSLFGLMKLWWEFGVIFSASFWLGVLWKKTNRNAVWTSIVATLLVFFVIPIIIVVVNPSLRSREYLVQQTEQRIIKRTYVAKEIDVVQRNQEIKKWEIKFDKEEATAKQPVSINVGENFVKEFQLPRKAVFWNQGVTTNDKGDLVGKGMLSMELVLLDKLGFEMANNKPAINETIRVLIRTLFPFLLIIFLSLVLPRKEEEKETLDKFYVKMKTPVNSDLKLDRKEIEISYANPFRFDNNKLFGEKSSWQFMKWDKTDSIGFAVNLLIVTAIIGLLYLVVNIGG